MGQPRPSRRPAGGPGRAGRPPPGPGPRLRLRAPAAHRSRASGSGPSTGARSSRGTRTAGRCAWSAPRATSPRARSSRSASGTARRSRSRSAGSPRSEPGSGRSRPRPCTWAPELFRHLRGRARLHADARPMQDFFPVEHRDAFMRAIEQATAGGPGLRPECPLRHHAGPAALGPGDRPGGIPRGPGRPALRGGPGHHRPARGARRPSASSRPSSSRSRRWRPWGPLAGGIAHDFNNLLTGIMGYQDLALDTLARGAPLEGLPERGRNACLAGPGTGRADPHLQPPDRRRQAGARRPGARHRGGPRASSGPPSPRRSRSRSTSRPNCGRVLADPTQIHQVLLNLGTQRGPRHALERRASSASLSPRSSSTPAQAAAHGNLPAGDYLSA